MFEYYEELPDGTVRVFFTDGTTDECDLLVGADGFNSRIKKQMLPYVTQETKDMAVIYFKVPLTQHTMHLMETAGSVMVSLPLANV
jgi:2-polyprenyl-6-methoxyphenol hydroxylase-like FAD-dependent oxidoreductase